MKFKFFTLIAFLCIMLSNSAFSLLGDSKAAVTALPADLPIPIVDKIDNPSPGGLFLSPFGPAATDTGKYKSYLMILDSACNVVSNKLVPKQDQGYIGYHFKEEPNGLLSYLNRKMDGTIFLTDTSYNILTTIQDSLNKHNRIKYYAHFDLLPNGNYLTVKYDFQYADHSKYFPDGEPNGAVLQAVVQELDRYKNVVFQWRSLDYIPVPKTYNSLVPNMDYFHPNSMVLSNDGNLLLSGRDVGSIIKINRNTGEIMWTLGGKDNQFTFIGEHEENAPTYFSYQHDIRILPNGNITLFDNGRQHKPQYSRAVEYQLDEAKKTCKLVWEYRHIPDFYADQHGSTQRLPNGNTLIAWGQASMGGGTALTEIHPDNSIALECHFPVNLESQFIYKYPWPVCPVIASVKKQELLELNTYDFNTTGSKTGISITFPNLQGFVYNSLTVDKFDCSPMNPAFDGRPPVVSPYRFLLKPQDINSMKAEIHVALTEYPLVFNPKKTLVYFRTSEGKGTFKPIPTTFDPTKNELVAISDSAGEFVLGYPDSATVPKAPILLAPENDEKVALNKSFLFTWSPKGYYDQCEFNIARDSKFDTLVTVLIGHSFYKYSQYFGLPNLRYYWRVRTINEAGKGEWSETRSFTAVKPYLAMTIPNGGEVWDTTNNIIRWEYNLKDSVNCFFKIDLYRNGKFVKNIANNRFSAVNAFKWKITADTPSDSTYQIKVTNTSDTTLASISSNFFTIKNGPTGIKEIPEDNGLSIQHYPNPFTQSTQFDISTSIAGNISLKIYDLLGNEVATVVDNNSAPGNFSINWTPENLSAGSYTYILRSGNSKLSGSLIKTK